MNFPLTVMIKYYAMENVTMMNRCHHFAYFVMKELYIQEISVIKELKIIAILTLQVKKIVQKIKRGIMKKIFNFYLNE